MVVMKPFKSTIGRMSSMQSQWRSNLFSNQMKWTKKTHFSIFWQSRSMQSSRGIAKWTRTTSMVNPASAMKSSKVSDNARNNNSRTSNTSKNSSTSLSNSRMKRTSLSKWQSRKQICNNNSRCSVIQASTTTSRSSGESSTPIFPYSHSFTSWSSTCSSIRWCTIAVLCQWSALTWHSKLHTSSSSIDSW